VKVQARRAIPQAEARRIIRTLNIQAADEIDLELIAAHYGVLVREEEIQGAEARLVREKDAGIIAVRRDITPPGRKRFAIAHELGHFFLHPDTRQVALCTTNDMNTWAAAGIRAEESEANEFAASLLMPEDLFVPSLKGNDPSFELISKLAEEFASTLTASAIQFVKATRETCALVVSDGKTRTRYTPSVNFAADFHLREDAAIHKYTCAAEVATGTQTHARASNVPAGCWLDGYDPDGKETVTEDSIRLGAYGTVLSLVWIDDDI
jgi:Zn-dependent peptidase ImmA (M78 family)